jgi:hypothetical protein
MNQQRNLIPTLVLAAILGGLSSTSWGNSSETSADTRGEPQALTSQRLSDQARDRPEVQRAETESGFRLSLEQMDQVHGGMINNETPPPVPPYGSDGRGVTCRHLSCAGL